MQVTFWNREPLSWLDRHRLIKWRLVVADKWAIDVHTINFAVTVDDPKIDVMCVLPELAPWHSLFKLKQLSCKHDPVLAKDHDRIALDRVD